MLAWSAFTGALAGSRSEAAPDAVGACLVFGDDAVTVFVDPGEELLDDGVTFRAVMVEFVAGEFAVVVAVERGEGSLRFVLVGGLDGFPLGSGDDAVAVRVVGIENGVRKPSVKFGVGDFAVVIGVEFVKDRDRAPGDAVAVGFGGASDNPSPRRGWPRPRTWWRAGTGMTSWYFTYTDETVHPRVTPDDTSTAFFVRPW